MNILNFVLLLPVLLLVGISFSTSNRHKPLVVMATVSSVYYGVFSSYYWVYYQDATFISVYWGRNELLWLTTFLNWSTLFLVVVLIFFERYLNFFIAQRNGFSDGRTVGIAHKLPLFRIDLAIFLVGWISTVYVVVSGVTYGGLNLDDQIILIAYQFSDILVPYLLYKFGSKGLTRVWVLQVIAYTAYSLLMGFRYKSMLLLAPLFLLFFLDDPDSSNQKGNFKRKFISLFFVGLLLAAFSLLTSSRKKFEGIDLSAVSEQSTEDVLYGIFAEGNILFGLMSIFETFWKTDKFIYFDPIFDSFIDFVPKALYPSKVVGAHMQRMLEGLGTEAALYSGTAYPYIGEYMMMYGFIGVIIGLVTLALICNAYGYCLLRFAHNSNLRRLGFSLIGVFVGYYYYSRGYMPQFVKGLIFTLGPYLLLLASDPNSESSK